MLFSKFPIPICPHRGQSALKGQYIIGPPFIIRPHRGPIPQGWGLPLCLGPPDIIPAL